MSQFNFLVFLNSYQDTNPSNNPTMSNFKWNRNVNGLTVNNPLSFTGTVAASGSQTIFTGSAVKRMTYLEVDQICTVTINGTINITVKPIIQGTSTYPGILFLSSDITSLSIANTSATVAANVFVASLE